MARGREEFALRAGGTAGELLWEGLAGEARDVLLKNHWTTSSFSHLVRVQVVGKHQVSKEPQ